MSQVLSNVWSGDNRALQILLILAAVVVVAAVIFFIFRLVFGHRLRIPGVARGRQPRLGLVDAFSLDGQRQLVIVRRDNVEHLLMIGGPNDLVVESQILRVAAPVASLPREGGAKLGQPLPAPSASAIAPAPAARIDKPVAAEQAPPAPRVMKSTQNAAAVEDVRPAPAAAPEPTPIVARAPEPAAMRPPSAPARRLEPAMSSPEPVQKPEAGPVPRSESPPARPALPPSVPPRLRPTPIRPPLPQPIGARSAASASPNVNAVQAPSPPAAVASPAPAALRPPTSSPGNDTPPSASTAPVPKPDEPFSDLESLEAEMARLLGRNP